jgi:hypothetical protein
MKVIFLMQRTYASRQLYIHSSKNLNLQPARGKTKFTDTRDAPSSFHEPLRRESKTVVGFALRREDVQIYVYSHAKCVVCLCYLLETEIAMYL